MTERFSEVFKFSENSLPRKISLCRLGGGIQSFTLYTTVNSGNFVIVLTLIGFFSKKHLGVVYFLSCTKLCKKRAEGILRSFLPLEVPGPIKKFKAKLTKLPLTSQSGNFFSPLQLLSVKVTYCLEDKIVTLSI